MLFETSVLDPDTIDLLHRLGKHLKTKGFFLVGGTALAIQINHRKSIDLDFFTRDPFDTEDVLSIVSQYSSSDKTFALTGRADNTLNLIVNSVKIDVIRYSYPLLNPLIETEFYQMASVEDIAAMKLSAITNRGSKKDFFDLYYLLKQYSLTELLELYQRKFENYDPFIVIRSLSYFDDAETEPDPLLLAQISWEAVKEELIQQVGKLA